MGILLTNGDSFTYGDELGGSRDPDGNDSHHHHTFTHKLSEILDKEYVNLAQNGSSNMKIYRRTLDFLINPTDHVDFVVIMWSNWGRFELCENDRSEADKQIFIPQECNMNQIIPSHKSDSFLFEWGDDSNMDRRNALKEYTENVLTMQTQILHGLTFMRHIQYICDMECIPVIQGVIHGDMYNNILASLKQEGYEEYKQQVIKILRELRDECRMGLGKYTDIYYLSKNEFTLKPGGHADENAHTEFARLLNHIIVSKELFSCY